MKKLTTFFRSKGGVICIIVAAVLLVAGGTAFGAYEYWLYQQPKFHDVTIELGTDAVSISDFMTEYAKSAKSTFVTDVSTVDLNETGDISLVLAHGKKEETVTLHIIDTTAPTVEFVTTLTETLDYEPDPADFVVSVKDFAPTTITFADETEERGTADDDAATATDAESETTEEVLSEYNAAGFTADFADKIFTVLVTDASGNVTSAECELHYEWIISSWTMELGETVSKEDLLIKADVGAELIADEDIEAINTGGAGEYVVASTLGERTEECTVTVQDTVAPELTLQEIHIYSNETATLEDFVVSSYDISGDVELRLMSDLPIGVVGIYTVTVEAEDMNGNITSVDTVFEVKADDIAPVISGLTDISLYEHADAPNYTRGVSASDNIDGTLEFTYDASAVDLDTAGTYYVIYTASDMEGNVAEEKRKVTVLKDEDPPVFSGLSTITKYQGTAEPNYTSGVSATDNVDGSVSWTYDAGSVNMNVVGTYYITYTASDKEGNVASVTRKLVVKKDDVAPEISGLTSISLKKNADKPDYLSGVSATDNIDSSVTVTYDDSSVNYSKTGTYYVVYKATDTAGNTATKKRKVTIVHNSDDTASLVASIADELSADAVEIKKYVKNNISYSHNDGGDDPVWYGFTNKTGDCYVHALCLQALLEYKGFETQLIWTTCKTHYWIIVKVDGTWWHIDATPGTQHQKYSGLMTDAQRLSTLSGRTWDTSLWPSCG
ncbi:MAG: DUF5011 domain-containing protein [Lachnospiraceae bacterium]|nr:DUF5011 domain-containing protein [Lachnospiraceae bacterium]